MDRRDVQRSYGNWYDRFDESTMKLYVDKETEDVDIDGEPIVQSISIPASYAVCGLCDGKGKHVNPSIDYNGISQEEFDEDPDFEEAYFEGAFDVTCYRCLGKRVEPMVAWDQLTNEQSRIAREAIEYHQEYVSESESESRWC